MEHATTYSLVFITLLKLCCAERPGPWFSANVINDGDFSPKPISELFTTSPSFSPTNPIVVQTPQGYISTSGQSSYSTQRYTDERSSTLSPPTLDPNYTSEGDYGLQPNFQSSPDYNLFYQQGLNGVHLPPSGPQPVPPNPATFQSTYSMPQSTLSTFRNDADYSSPQSTFSTFSPDLSTPQSTYSTFQSTYSTPQSTYSTTFGPVSSPQPTFSTFSPGTQSTFSTIRPELLTPSTYSTMRPETTRQTTGTFQTTSSISSQSSLSTFQTTPSSTPMPQFSQSTFIPPISSSAMSTQSPDTIRTTRTADCNNATRSGFQSLRIRVLSPRGSITNVLVNPPPPSTTTRRPKTTRSTTTRTKKAKRNSYDACVNGCNRTKRNPICASPLAVAPINADTLKGFPSVCHMACHNSFRKDHYQMVIEGRCGKLRTRIRTFDSPIKLKRDELNKSQYTIVEAGPQNTVVEFSSLPRK